MLLSYVQYFLYLVSSLINVSIFHSTWMDTFWTYHICIPWVIITKKVLSLFVNNLPGTWNAQNNKTNDNKLGYMNIAFSSSVS